MKVQGIVVNSEAQQESGSNVKVLKIEYDAFGNPPIIIENTTGTTFTINPDDYVEIIPADNTYFTTNKFWIHTHFIFDDSDPMNTPFGPTPFHHHVTTSGKLVVQRPGGLNILTIFVI